MLKCLRKCHRSFGVSGAGSALAVAVAAALAGCSADISRFDLGNPEGARVQSGYAPSVGMSGRSTSSEFGTAANDRPSQRPSQVSRSDLPPPDGQFTTSALSPQHSDSSAGYGSGYGHRPAQHPSQQAYGSNRYESPSYGAAGSSGYGGSRDVAPVANYESRGGGDSIEVRSGDTLYGLSRRHGVSVNELMRANGLTSSNLQPGQRLVLPSGSGAPQHQPSYESPRVAAAAPVAPAASAPSDWNDTYTVQPGDSLYAIARTNGISLADLERYNGIQDSRRVMPGTVLRVPGEAGASTQVAEAPPAYQPPPAAYQAPPAQQPMPRTTIETRPVQTQEHRPAQEARNPTGTVRLGDQRVMPPGATAQQPTLLNGSSTPPANGEQRVARLETPGSASDAVSPAASQSSGSVAGSSKLRWPVVGKVVGGFGPRPDGTHNDGVNLSAPMGTDIHAAESGVVAYAGDELKGYGNLVLIRHENGWVTAYAHADEILVKRGDRINRGQVIAKVGRTGQVDQPQLHFELRQGQKPVDPTPFMERI